MLNGLTTIYKNQRLTFINKRGIFICLAIVSSWLSNLVKQYAAMTRHLKNSFISISSRTLQSFSHLS